jgi:hypothetical protein
LLLVEGVLLLISQCCELVSSGAGSPIAAFGVIVALPAILAWLIWFGGSLIDRSPFQFSMRSLLVLTAVVAILGVLGVRWFRAAQQEQEIRRSRPCSRQVKNILFAFHFYHEEHGHSPPAYIADANGNPMHSWRVLILPYMGDDGAAVYSAYRFDEPWNGPNNRKLAAKVAEMYRCPNRPPGENPLLTDYVVVVGPDTAFPGTETVTLTDFPDGTKNTILIVEIENSDIHWMEPRDLRLEDLSFAANQEGTPRVAGPHAAGPVAGFADGSVSRLHESLRPQTLRAMLTRRGGEDIDRDLLEGERPGVGTCLGE